MGSNFIYAVEFPSKKFRKVLMFFETHGFTPYRIYDCRNEEGRDIIYFQPVYVGYVEMDELYPKIMKHVIDIWELDFSGEDLKPGKDAPEDTHHKWDSIKKRYLQYMKEEKKNRK